MSLCAVKNSSFEVGNARKSHTEWHIVKKSRKKSCDLLKSNSVYAKIRKGSDENETKMLFYRA